MGILRLGVERSAFVVVVGLAVVGATHDVEGDEGYRPAPVDAEPDRRVRSAEEELLRYRESEGTAYRRPHRCLRERPSNLTNVHPLSPSTTRIRLSEATR